jgi:hypothetical protein
MLRDGIELDTLCSMGSGSSRGRRIIASVVAVIAEIRPIIWERRRKTGTLVEYLEFFASDDTLSLFKIRCWGDSALHVASKLKPGSLYLMDRLDVHCGGTGGGIGGGTDNNNNTRTETYGIWSCSQTTLHLLCSPPGGIEVDPLRYAEACERVDAVRRSMKRLTGRYITQQTYDMTMHVWFTI